jgi:hypothetical protein
MKDWHSRFGFLQILTVAGLLLLSAWSVQGQDIPRVEIVQDIAHAVSGPLRDSNRGMDHPNGPPSPVPRRSPGSGSNVTSTTTGVWIDPDLQTGTATTPGAPIANFDGIAANGSIPPDTNLAVGASQVVQIVNTEVEVFDKSGNPLAGPVPIHVLFTTLGGLCGSTDGGDVSVLYDAMAGRWIISQLAYNRSLTSNFLCIAVSTTSDAAGSYALYSMNFGYYLPDYPKLGVWPDGYYTSANMFFVGAFFVGAKTCALNRAAMLAGTRAFAVCFQLSTNAYNLLPADLDGATLPAAGEPNFYMQFVANSSGVGSTLNLYKFHLNLTSPGSSTFTGPTQLSSGTYHEACGGGTCIPQAGTSQQLDSLGDRLMYRLQYRNFGAYESLVTNHAVQVSSSTSQTGLRWYEIRNPATSPVVYQQSTYAPDAANYRWMGSIAQDKVGDMAIGYSVSSSAINPAIYYAGRSATDALNNMSPEQLIINGTGSQTGYSRWGDYSSMAIDQADDCTFWYTTEYLTNAGNFNWQTRIANFKFPNCQ